MFFEAKNLHAFYGTSHVLQGIDIAVEDGEIVGLLGRNGVGKSTILKTIMGLVKLKSGAIIFKGQDNCFYPVGLKYLYMFFYI